jgi:hypothetical protein
MADQRDKNFTRGIIALVVGLALALAGGLWAHFAELPEFDNVGRELYPHIPRGWEGWLSALLGKLVSLAGILIALAGITLAFLYEKTMTWARAAIGAFVFTSLMIIIYGVIPNEWLTYTQAVWEWTDQKLWIQIPDQLLGGNELNISAAAMKDFISAGWILVATAGTAVAMIRWQKRDEYRAKREKKAEGDVSVYGRPLQKADS